jgi:hypothetical protein
MCGKAGIYGVDGDWRRERKRRNFLPCRAVESGRGEVKVKDSREV